MTWGHQLGYLEGLRDDLGVMPRALADRPEQHDLGGDLFRAFNTLSSSRHYGMGGPLPISISEMAAFCQLFDISAVDDRETFVATMQRLDSVYLTEVSKRNATTTTNALAAGPVTNDNLAKG